MKLRSATPLAGFSLLAIASVAAVHCGSGIAPHPYGEAPTATATSTSPPLEDGGAGAPFQYVPQGCAYTFTPSTTRPYTGYALDTQTAPGGAATDSAPQLVRVGLAGNTTKGGAGYADPTTTSAFSWITTAPNTNARLHIGASPTAMTDVHTGYVYTSPPPTVAFGSTEPPAYFHEVDVCGLSPATTYYYQVGGGAAGSEIWSATQSFTTVPVSGKITVGVFGDARDLVATWQLVNERMRDAAPSMLLVSGDIVDIGQEESLYTQWLTAIWHDPSVATDFVTLGQFIMVPIAGNHEQDTSQFFANFPIPGGGDYAKEYDSFDVGNTHFIMIDDQQIAEAPTSPDAAAILAWVDADLDAANKDRTAHPFIVAISHRGMYSTSNHATDGDVIQTRASIAPLYDKYHVNLALNGHDHEYERSYPLNVGSPPTAAPVVKSSITEGTTYVINAGAGADPYQVGTYPSDYRDGNPTPLGSFSTKGYIGCYVLLTLGGTTLTLTAYGMKAGGGGVAGDDVIDTLTFGQ